MNHSKTQTVCKKNIIIIIGFMVNLFGFVSPLCALQVQEILVIANKNAFESVTLAKYYMEKRDIPKSHLLQVWVTDKETCSREDYERKVVPRVRDYLRKNDPLGNIHCLVTMYGLPLKVSPPAMSSEEKKQVQVLQKRREIVSKELKAVPKEETEKKKQLEEELKAIGKQIGPLASTTIAHHLTLSLPWCGLKNTRSKDGFLIPILFDFKNENSRSREIKC